MIKEQLIFKDAILNIEDLYIESNLSGLLEGGYISPIPPDYVNNALESYNSTFSEDKRLYGQLEPLIINPEIKLIGEYKRKTSMREITYYNFNLPTHRFTAFVTLTSIIDKSQFEQYGSYEGVIIWFQDEIDSISDINKERMNQLLFKPYALEFEY